MPSPEEVAADYFGQSEYYFSESQKQLIRIDEMVPQYALNCLRKLLREYQESFRHSPLYTALVEHVSPRSRDLRDVLRTHGTALVFTDELVSVNAARKRLRRAGASETHKRDEWVEGTAAPAQIVVKRRKERAHA